MFSHGNNGRIKVNARFLQKRPETLEKWNYMVEISCENHNNILPIVDVHRLLSEIEYKCKNVS